MLSPRVHLDVIHEDPLQPATATTRGIEPLQFGLVIINTCTHVLEYNIGTQSSLHHYSKYHSVPGKHPWALKSRFGPAWALTRDITSMRLYRSCCIDPLKWGTWALTREWALARDTTVIAVIIMQYSPKHNIHKIGCNIVTQSIVPTHSTWIA